MLNAFLQLSTCVFEKAECALTWNRVPSYERGDNSLKKLYSKRVLKLSTCIFEKRKVHQGLIVCRRTSTVMTEQKKLYVKCCPETIDVCF